MSLDVRGSSYYVRVFGFRPDVENARTTNRSMALWASRCRMPPHLSDNLTRARSTTEELVFGDASHWLLSGSMCPPEVLQQCVIRADEIILCVRPIRTLYKD